MSPSLRKIMLTVHVASSVGLLGAVAAFLILAITGLVGQDPHVAHAAYPAMNVIARAVVLPLAISALLFGIVQSFGTRWGLFRHYWVLAKLVLTALATAVLLLQMPLISFVAGAAEDPTLTALDFREARIALVVHAAGGLLVLLLPTALSIYKPRGRTSYGRRKLREQRAAPAS